jgi:hypothetical protein
MLVSGSKESVGAALDHELTEGAVLHLQEYNRYFCRDRAAVTPGL